MQGYFSVEPRGCSMEARLSKAAIRACQSAEPNSGWRFTQVAGTIGIEFGDTVVTFRQTSPLSPCSPSF